MYLTSVMIWLAARAPITVHTFDPTTEQPHEKSLDHKRYATLDSVEFTGTTQGDTHTDQ